MEDVHDPGRHSGPPWRPCKSKEATLRSRTGQSQAGRGTVRRSGGISREELDQRRADRSKVERRLSSKPWRKSMSVAGRPRPPAQPREGHDLARRPQRPRPDFLRRPGGAGQAGPASAQVGLPRPAWTGRPSTPSTSSSKRDQEGNSIGSLQRLVPEAPAGQAGRGQAPPGPPRPRSGRAEPPLLRHRQRDRRRGDQPQRQPRQQRLRGAEPDGRPLAHRDLDRRQLQGDATGGPAHRPAGALRGRHVRRAGRSSRAASPASPWGPARPWPCCRRRTPRATS